MVTKTLPTLYGPMAEVSNWLKFTGLLILEKISFCSTRLKVLCACSHNLRAIAFVFLLLLTIAVYSSLNALPWATKPKLRLHGQREEAEVIALPWATKPKLRLHGQREEAEVSAGQCDVVQSMVRGYWVSRPYSQTEMEELLGVLQVSHAFFHLPASLQRQDGKCGNVTFTDETNPNSFRALCDPHGPQPCCFHNQCRGNLSPRECVCPACYDLRLPIHAELAEWVPLNPACQLIEAVGRDEICAVLGHTRLLLIGDSFIRHVHVALLTLLTADFQFGALKANLSQVTMSKCRGDLAYQTWCRNFLYRQVLECNKTMNLTYLQNYYVNKAQKILDGIHQLRAVPNSYVLLGMGIHDFFNLQRISTLLLKPLVATAKASRWPEIIWASTHAPGLLKSPMVPSQSSASIQIYNKRVRKLFHESRAPITIFELYNLTQGVVSFDGTHYGRGVNLVKARILLSYLRQRRARDLP